MRRWMFCSEFSELGFESCDARYGEMEAGRALSHQSQDWSASSCEEDLRGNHWGGWAGPDPRASFKLTLRSRCQRTGEC
jgi:hypothetical protein